MDFLDFKTGSSGEIKKERVFANDIAALFLLLFILAGFFFPLLFEGKVIFFRDFTVITYPIKSFLSQIYHQGAIPFWTQSIVHGTPFMGAYHPGVFYPPSLIFLMDDTTLALNLFYLLHFLILGWSVYILARSWEISIAGALCSSVTAMLSGFFMGSTLTSNFFLSAIWLPSVFYFFQTYLAKKRGRDFVGAVFCLACETLAACPEICIMTVVLLFFQTMFSMPARSALKDRLRPAVALAVVALLAISLSALQLFPTYKMVSLSERGGGLPFEVHTLWSMDYKALPSVILPTSFKSLKVLNEERSLQFLESVYLGIFAVMFLGLGFLFTKNRSIRFWVIVFFVGIFFALGKYNPLYQYFYPWVPLLSLFRYPEKYFYISAFALVFLTGFGLDALIKGTLKKEIKINHVIAVVLLLFACVGLIALWKTQRNPHLTLTLLMIFGLLFLSFYFKKISEVGFKSLIFLLILFDLFAKGYNIIPLIDKQFFESEPILATEIMKDTSIFRVYTGRLNKDPNKFRFVTGPSGYAVTLVGKEYLFPYFGMIYGIEYPDGIPALALELSDHWMWREMLKRSDPEKRFRMLKRSNVKYWIDGDSPTYFAGNSPLVLPDRLKVLDGFLPRAFLVNKASFGKEPILLNTYYSESFDPSSEVLLSQPVKWKEMEGFEGRVEEIKYKPNHVTVRSRQNGDGFLVLLDSYFPGWTVKVDGVEGTILQANHYFRAVKLGPGNHTVEFDYMPVGFKAGLAITLITVLVLLAISAWLIWRNRRGLPPAQE